MKEAQKRAYLHEEMAADACFDVLSNDAFLTEFCWEKMKTAEGEDLIRKIADFFVALAKKLRQIVRDLAHSTDNAIVRELIDDEKMLSEINKRFKELLDSAKAVDNSGESGEVKNQKSLDYSYEGLTKADFYADSKIYSYDFLVNQDDMSIVDIPEYQSVFTDRKLDRKKAVERGKNNALSIGGPLNDDGAVWVENAYTRRKIEISNQSIRHGLGEDAPYKYNNARAGSVAGEIISNGMPINELVPKPEVHGTYALVSYGVSLSGQTFLVISHIDINNNRVNEFDVLDITHSIKARYLGNKNSDTKKESAVAEFTAPSTRQKAAPFVASTISISDLLEIVKEVQPDILSKDVQNYFGIENTNGYYTGQVRHQRSLETVEEMDKADLLRENEMLREQVEYLRGETRLTDGATIDRGKLFEAVKGVLKSYDGGIKSDVVRAVSDRLLATYGYLRNGIDPAALQMEIYREAEKILSASGRTEGTEEYSDEEKSMRTTLRKVGITLNEEQMGEIAHAYGSMQEFRKMAIGHMTLRKEGGMPLDSIWESEVVPAYPELRDVTSSAEMPIKLFEAMRASTAAHKGEWVNMFEDTVLRLEAVTDLTLQIMDGVMNEQIVEAQRTFADKKKVSWALT